MNNSAKKILLAEDSPQDADITREALAGYHLSNHVVLVGDGEESLDYLYARGKSAGRADCDPSLVLRDPKAPEVDCLEVLRTIKSDEKLRTFPAVMQSGAFWTIHNEAPPRA